MHGLPHPIPGQLSSHRALRKARGLSQAQLGGVLGVGQTRITTRIEHDPTAISVEQLLGILSALGVQMVPAADRRQGGAGPCGEGQAPADRRALVTRPSWPSSTSG